MPTVLLCSMLCSTTDPIPNNSLVFECNHRSRIGGDNFWLRIIVLVFEPRHIQMADNNTLYIADKLAITGSSSSNPAPTRLWLFLARAQQVPAPANSVNRMTSSLPTRRSMCSIQPTSECRCGRETDRMALPLLESLAPSGTSASLTTIRREPMESSLTMYGYLYVSDTTNQSDPSLPAQLN